MEEFSIQPLSEGLGFYDPPQTAAPQVPPSVRAGSASQVPPLPFFADNIPQEFWPDTWAPQNKKAYDELQALLEKPHLNHPTNSTNALNHSPNNPSPTHNPSYPATPTNALNHSPTPDPSHNPNPSPNPSPSPTPTHTTTSKGIKTSGAFLFQGAFSKILHSWVKAGLMDALTASFFFFAPFILFLFLTEKSMSTLGLLWPQISLAFLLFLQMYCLLCRLFCFETCGEAMAKIRLVSPKSKGPAHPFLLFWRALLSCFTGFVLLPLASLLFKKDLTGYLTGLYFQKLSK